MNCDGPSGADVRFLWQDDVGAMRVGVGSAREISQRGVLINAQLIPSPGTQVEVIVDLPMAKVAGKAIRLIGKGVVGLGPSAVEDSESFASEALLEADCALIECTKWLGKYLKTASRTTAKALEERFADPPPARVAMEPSVRWGPEYS